MLTTIVLRTMKLFSLLAILVLLVSTAWAQDPSKEKNKKQAFVPMAGSNPVVGSGTPGQITKWTGVFGTSTYSIGDSNITEDKFGKVGIGTAFFLGLLMDVHDATLLGENALAYTLLSYFAIMMHRRVLWFRVWTQAMHVLPLLILAQGVQLLVRFIVSSKFPGWFFFLESIVAALLWPVVTMFLLAPQRRAVDKDHTRPI